MGQFMQEHKRTKITTEGKKRKGNLCDLNNSGCTLEATFNQANIFTFN